MATTPRGLLAVRELDALLTRLLVDDLKRCCSIVGVSRGGRKAELQMRIKQQVLTWLSTNVDFVLGTVMPKLLAVGNANAKFLPTEVAPAPSASPAARSIHASTETTLISSAAASGAPRPPTAHGGFGHDVAPTVYSFAPIDGTRSSACVCGAIHPGLPSTSQVQCTDCGVIYNSACATMASGSLCFLCYARHAEPLHQHVSVLMPPRLLSNTRDVVAQFIVPPYAFDKSQGYAVELMSVKVTKEKGEPGRFLVWPREPTLYVNRSVIDIRVMLDRTGHIAPCIPLNISSYCAQSGSTSLSFRTHEPKLHCVMVVVTKTVSVPQCISSVLSKHALSRSLAEFSVLASFASPNSSPLKTISGIRSASNAGDVSTTLRNYIHGAGSSDDDIVAASTIIALKDSVSWSPIDIPIRSDTCRHLQCIDLKSFLMLYERPSLKRWECPVCHNVVKVSSLCVDTYFLGILDAMYAGVRSGGPLAIPAAIDMTPASVVMKPRPSGVVLPDKIQIEPDGSWRVLDDDSPSSEPPMKRYLPAPSAAGVRTPASSGPPTPSEAPVIDLLSSDDDDEVECF